MARARSLLIVAILALLVTVLESTLTPSTSSDESPNGGMYLFEKQIDLIAKYRKKSIFKLELDRNSPLLEQSIKLFDKTGIQGIPVVSFKGDLESVETNQSTLKEYLSLFSNEILDPKYEMFNLDGKKLDLSTPIDGEHLNEYEFLPEQVDIGRLRCLGHVIAMAILNEQFMDISFGSTLYDIILGKIDVNSPAMVVCQAIFEVIPQQELAMFSEKELRLLISGDSTSDIKDWSKFTDNQFITEQDQVLTIAGRLIMQRESSSSLFTTQPDQCNDNLQHIKDKNTIAWFFDIVMDMKKEQREQLLSFITGQSRYPIGLIPDSEYLEYSSDNDSDEKHIAYDLPWFMTIRWSGMIDMPPTADPYKNKLYLSTYNKKEVLKQHLETIADSKSGVATWFASAAQFRGKEE